MCVCDPPFSMTDQMTDLIAEISEEVGRIVSLPEGKEIAQLRRENRLRTIHFSLAIEQNSLSLKQVRAIVEGEKVNGDPREIREVTNAWRAYDLVPQIDPLSADDLLKAHKVMMEGLTTGNGRFRSGSVGVFSGSVLVHLAPPARFVPQQIRNLFSWYASSGLHPLIKSCVFHYELEFIHPFGDGNGRMGRMWQSLLLGQWRELFLWLPVEELLFSRREEYYQALGIADGQADSAVFVEFLLSLIRDSLKMEFETVYSARVSGRETDRDKTPVERLLACLGDETLSAAQLMKRLHLSHRPTFRKNYLNPALEQQLIERTIPDKSTSRNQKYRKTKSV